MNFGPSPRGPLTLVLAGVLALAGVATAAPTDAIVSPNGVEIRPYRTYESAVLQVSGPEGLVLEQQFDGSSSIWLPLLDDRGAALPDGEYTWSLTLTPTLSAKVREQLRQARENGDDSVILELRASGALPDPADMVTSGALRVLGGAFVVPSSEAEQQVRTTGEAAAKGVVSDQDVPTRDQVIIDDLIVTGSACVGQDCVNGESFGFDTIRLKENNLRIKFQDTSNSGSFPSNDWQLTANDSSNGGANKFSIDDIDSGRTPFTIEASAPSNSLYVDDGGRVGLGTATPSVELHVVDGDTPTLRLQQDGSSGFTPQTWDIAGNEANFFVRDVTNGSTLPFKVFPNAPTNSLTVEGTTGDVGIGTSSPAAPLHIVENTGTVATLLQLTNNHAARLAFENTSTGTVWFVRVGNTSSAFGISDDGDSIDEFNLDTAGNLTIAGTLTEGSDVNSKTSIEAVDAVEVLSKVMELPITTWAYTSDSTRARHMGPMAQDFYSAFGLGPTETGISARNLSSVALVALQELYRQVEEKDARITRLEQELAAVSARLEPASN